MMPWKQLIGVVATALMVPIAAHAAWDAEVDPIAFALSGYSAHAGYRVNHLRADLGVYGAEVPEVWHGNKGWTERTNGIGAKLDWAGSDRGLFAGLEADYNRTKYTLRYAAQSVSRSAPAVGGRAGYRFVLGRSRLYIAPWVGVDYTFGEIGASIGGRKFDEKRIGLFPTVHLGWRF
jgi:hypothetical protein